MEIWRSILLTSRKIRACTRYFCCLNWTSVDDRRDLLDPSRIIVSTDCSHSMSSVNARRAGSSCMRAAWTTLSLPWRAVISCSQSLLSFSSRHRNTMFPGCADISWLPSANTRALISARFSASLPTSWHRNYNCILSLKNAITWQVIYSQPFFILISCKISTMVPFPLRIFTIKWQWLCRDNKICSTAIISLSALSASRDYTRSSVWWPDQLHS